MNDPQFLSRQEFKQIAAELHKPDFRRTLPNEVLTLLAVQAAAIQDGCPTDTDDGWITFAIDQGWITEPEPGYVALTELGLATIQDPGRVSK